MQNIVNAACIVVCFIFTFLVLFCFVLLCLVQVNTISHTTVVPFAKPCQVKVALGQEMTRGLAERKHAADGGYVVW